MLPSALKPLLTTPSRKFAVLVVLGMCMVALPMADVWRRLGLELRAASTAQHGLTPLALNLQTQQALAAHRPYAAAVLSGRLEQEGERARRQSDVDGRLAMLGAALETQRLYRALDEADQLRSEWSAVLQGIGQRRLRPAASDNLHQLLIEQTYVIADLVATATGLHGQAGRAFSVAEGTLALVVLPRYAAALAAQADAASTLPAGAQVPSGAASERANSLRAMARSTAQAASDVLAEAGAPVEAPSPNKASSPDPRDQAISTDMLAALLSLRQSAKVVAERASQAVEEGSAAQAIANRAAHESALQAAAALVEHLKGRIGSAQESLRIERGLVAAAGLVAFLVAAMAASLALPRAGSKEEVDLQAQPQGAGTDAAGEDTLPLPFVPAALGAESEQPTSELLQRLRRNDRGVDIDIDSRDTAQPDPPTGR